MVHRLPTDSFEVFLWYCLLGLYHPMVDSEGAAELSKNNMELSSPTRFHYPLYSFSHLPKEKSLVDYP
jgi:hypothetical protein